MKAEITKPLIDTILPRAKKSCLIFAGGDKPFEVRDTKLSGFILRAQPRGKRTPGQMTYICQFGRSKRTSIGATSVVTLAQARERAKDILAQVRLTGTDPIVEKRKAKARAHTLETYLSTEYAPHLKAHHANNGTASMNRLKTNFLKPFGKLKLHEITAAAVEKWRDKRTDKDGKAVATVNRDVNCLKAALSKAVKWDFISENPLASVKPLEIDKAPRVRHLADAEEYRLRVALDAREAQMRQERASANIWRQERGYELFPALDRGFADYLKPMILLLLNTGCRRGEIFNLKWADIDLDQAILTVEGSSAKTGQTRYINLNDEALHTLKTWKAQDSGKNDLVFPGRNGERMTNIKTAWRRLLEEAKITGFRLHDLRHTFASNLVMADVNLRTVQELLGHTDPKITTRYAHLSSEIKAAAVQKLGQGKRLHLTEVDPLTVSNN